MTAQQRLIKPIETKYGGFRFRSRLEARWAVFFDKLGIKWLYEPQGFDVDGRAYLPDFCLLLGSMLWAEVKPSIDADPDGVSRFRSFIAARGERGVVLTDFMSSGPYLVLGANGDGSYWENDGYLWMQCPDGYHFDVRPGFGRSENDGQCDQCDSTASGSVFWSRRSDVVHGGTRLQAAYDAARAHRFERR